MLKVYLAQAKHKNDKDWGIGQLCLQEKRATYMAKQRKENSIYLEKDIESRVVVRYIDEHKEL